MSLTNSDFSTASLFNSCPDHIVLAHELEARGKRQGLEFQYFVLLSHSLAFFKPLELERPDSSSPIKGAGNKSLIVACDANLLATGSIAGVFAEQASSEAVVLLGICEGNGHGFVIHYYLVENILKCQHDVIIFLE